MKNRYSILLGMGIVMGISIPLDTFLWYNSTLLTDLFIVSLFMGGFVSTFTSPGTKARVGLISGLGVSFIFTAYTLMNSTTVPVSLGILMSSLILPGVIMCIGGYLAKLVKMEMSHAQ